MLRSVLVRALPVAALVMLSLSACGQLRPSQKMEVFEATLSGREEVPPNATTGTGQAEVQYNENSGMLRWKVTYAGTTGPLTGAHIHGPAGPGQNAGVVVPFPNVASSPIQGETKLTPQQASQLMAGQWYVNLHTAQHPGGEIRGQLRPRR